MRMKADTLVTNVGQLVTCASGGRPKRGASMQDAGIIEDAAVAIMDGMIAAFGSSQDIEASFESDQIFDTGGRAVCPGFVDPHTHIVFAGDRLNEFELKIKGADYLEILANGGGIISTVEKTRAADLDDLIAASIERLNKMLACGTTTAEVKTGYGLDLATEIKMLHAIAALDRIHPIDLVPTFLGAHAVPKEFAEGAEAYVDLICGEMLPEACDWFQTTHFPASKRPFFADVFCEKNAFNLDQTERILRTAKALWFGLKAHVDEFTNLGGSALAIEMGAASIDHLDAISDAEVALLAASETIGVVTPAVNFNFGSTHFADARKLIDAGCAVALSTDYNPGSAPCPSQPMAMAIACRYQHLLPAEAMNAATVNAAYAIGLGDKAGSIEVGKQADLVVLDSRDYRSCAHEFGGNPVLKVFKSGREVAPF